ncbi:MAG: protein translocase subunit SecD [Actinomycetota bacterium]|nr:protein translocase subunit SecD [Actinomycetota bacterium]
MARAQTQIRGYFVALALIIAALYALVFFTGDSPTPRLGLDLRGGTTVTLTAQTRDGGAPSAEELETARQIIERRVNGLGVAEAEVVTEGDSNIVISVPGDEGEQARSLGTTAELLFRPVIAGPEPVTAVAPEESADPTASGDPQASADPALSGDPAASTDPAATTDPVATTDPAVTDDTASTTDGSAADPDRPAVTQEEAQATYAALTECSTEVDATQTLTDRPEDYVAACSTNGTEKYLLGPTIILGTDVEDATAGLDPSGTSGWVVTLDLESGGDPDAQRVWAEYTAANVGNNVAFTLDDRVVSAPNIESAISGTTTISGSFTQETATSLANSLKYGALPLTFTQSTAETVSGLLAADQLRAGLIAGGIGILLVFVYALFYYRLLGLVTIASLLLSAVIVYACLVILGRQIGFTLSLAGIAGFIVAIGITADSFIILFERIKDEVRDGRSMRAAVPRAWVSSRRTILSADAVSFLAAATLYVLAIGGVKGFAFTLGISTVLDLVVVFLFTHPLVALLSRNPTFASPRVSGLGRLRVGGGAAGTPATATAGGGSAAAARSKTPTRGTSTNRGGS